MFAFRRFLNILIPVFQYSIFFIYLFSDSLTRFLLFKISGIEVFKKPRNTNTPGTQNLQHIMSFVNVQKVKEKKNAKEW